MEANIVVNLRRWQESHQPKRWVERHQGHWDHENWLALLDDLETSEFWPLDLEAVGRVLEKTRLEWRNLRRWQESGAARAWVESHGGRWDHQDWLGLLDTLRRSEFWPLDVDAVGGLLKRVRQQARNLRRWEASGQARQWVEAHGGRWGHVDWLCLMETLEQSAFWPLDATAVGEVLERLKKDYWRLRHWKESGRAQAWVTSRRGQWNHNDWLALLAELQTSEGGPLEPAAVGAVLEELKRQYVNLRRWQESEQPRLWVEAHRGRWLHSDWLALLKGLQQSGFWPMDIAALGAVLEDLKGAANVLTLPRHMAADKKSDTTSARGRAAA